MATYVKQRLALFSAHLCVCITQDKADCSEKVALPGAITPDNDIVLGRERFYNRLVLVASLRS